jgi:hypothetical protein
MEAFQTSSETLKDEKRELEQQLEELKLSAGPGDGSALHGDSVDSIELLPPSVRQRITRLEVSYPKVFQLLTSIIDVWIVFIVFLN